MKNIFTPPKRPMPGEKKILFSTSDSKRSNFISAKHFVQNQIVSEFADTQHQFTIIWIKSGGAKLLSHDQEHIITANRLLCFPPSQRVLLIADEEIDAYVISFSEDFLFSIDGQNTYPFSNWYSSDKLFNQYIESETELGSGLESIMKLVVRDYENGCSFGTEIFKGVIQVLIVYFSRSADLQSITRPERSQDETIFKSFLQLLETHYVTKKTVMHYADLLAVTPNYLSDTVRKISGYPASFYIHQRIIREAKRVAIGPRVSLKEVAYQVGFPDVAHFSKFFRNQVGMNFTEYQRLLS